jgi:dihydrolipoamide dehydrogenase
MDDNNIRVDVAIVGAGTAGQNAMKQVQNAGKSFVLVDHGPLGTTCARVGCMPSKAVLHAGAIWQGRHLSADVIPGTQRDDTNVMALWHAAQRTRDMLATGAAGRTTAAAGEHLLMGRASFVKPGMLDVDGRRVVADAFVIASGSTPVVPTFLHEIRDRVLTTDSLFELEKLPASIGILGMGAIGLEMGLALSRLGVRVVGADLQSMVGGIADPEIGARALHHFATQPGLTMWLGSAVDVHRTASGVSMSNGAEKVEVEWVLAALGRKPAMDGLRLDRSGIALDREGRPAIDPQTMRAAGSSLFFAGDVHADRPLQHEAADEGMIAGWNAAHHDAAHCFQRRVAMAIVFSDPDIASVGLRFDHLDAQQAIIGTASGQTNGRSRILEGESNLIRIYADRANGRLLGASLFATRGENVAHLLAWAIQRGETAESLLEMPFYHPTIEEMVHSALADIVRQQALPRRGPLGLRDLGPESQTSR